MGDMETKKCCKCSNEINTTYGDNIGRFFICIGQYDNRYQNDEKVSKLINKPTDDFMNKYKVVKYVDNYVCNNCVQARLKEKTNPLRKQGLIHLGLLIPFIICFIIFISYLSSTFLADVSPSSAAIISGVFALPLLSAFWGSIKKIIGISVNENWAKDTISLEVFTEEKKEFINENKSQLKDIVYFPWYSIDEKRQGIFS